MDPGTIASLGLLYKVKGYRDNENYFLWSRMNLWFTKKLMVMRTLHVTFHTN